MDKFECFPGRSKEVLDYLRSNKEGGYALFGDGSKWADVYIDNAIPENMSRHEFAGYTSYLKKTGFYKPQTAEFGTVKLAS